MLFSSIPFLYYFFPAVLLVYFAVPRPFKNAVLLLASLIFYGWGEPVYLLLMVATIALFYICGLLIGKYEGNLDCPPASSYLPVLSCHGQREQ